MDNTGLTWEDLLAAFELIKKPPLYYIALDSCQPGQILHVQKGQYHPEYIVCHPDDVPELKEKITNRALTQAKQFRYEPHMRHPSSRWTKGN
jgi:hypothetical protein